MNVKFLDLIIHIKKIPLEFLAILKAAYLQFTLLKNMSYNKEERATAFEAFYTLVIIIKKLMLKN
jgi:hypothetical protein